MLVDRLPIYWIYSKAFEQRHSIEVLMKLSERGMVEIDVSDKQISYHV
jgi:hypothetical protein